MPHREPPNPAKMGATPTPGPSLGTPELELELELSDSGRAVLSVPAVPAGGAVPLMVMLHGGGGAPEQVVDLLGGQPASRGIAVLSPKSRGFTWDQIASGEVGTDPPLLDEALVQAYQRVNVDPTRLALAGFSDGASYALSLGLNNGDIFTHVIAFSPGFCMPAGMNGKPYVFVSHGVSDRVLRIEMASHRIVPPLLETGYMTEYKEFLGGHEAPEWIIGRGLDLLVGTPGARPKVTNKDRVFR
ncbi:MAG: alpha/beta hydrolase [Acidimicrobiia bacterium]